MGLGQSEEKDFSERLRLLVVDDDRATGPRRLAIDLRQRVGGHADVLVRDTVPRVAARCASAPSTASCSTSPAGDEDARERSTRSCRALPDVPVVVLADRTTQSIALRAIHDGAQDFLIEAGH